MMNILLLKTFIAIALSYGLGCFCTAYYLVRWRTGQDIRKLGSGAAGAKNAGRILGAKGFAITFLGDLLKGSLAMRLALALELEPWGIIMAFIAVVLGHLYPAQLGFRGGKGAAVGFGAVLVLDFPLAMILLAMAALIFALTRAFTLSGLITIALAPAIAWLLGNHGAFLIGLVIVVLLLLYAHRSNILALARGQRGAATLE